MFNGQHRQQGSGVAAFAVAVSMALVAATAVAANAAASPPPDGNPAAPRQRSGGPVWVTLITGDRVGVDARGGVTGYDPAEGRAGVPVHTHTDRGRTYAVPRDARRLIADGRLDRRLFDVTGLSGAESRKAHRDGLRLIVEYAGAAGPDARRSVRATGGTELDRPLRALNADAVTGTPKLWDTLTEARGRGARTTAPGISRIWLDGVVKATLDRSTGQIGAPRAWRSGWEGQGVRIAVLDTGVDADHPDLSGRVVAARNFSPSPYTTDRNGHGTHVASTAAGSGARSNGTHRGVAPRAEILSGKVLEDNGGGSESAILAGMEWAVAQGADIVNLSVTGDADPVIDPMEAYIDRATAETGVLFVVAAGNAGRSVIGSPGSADGAFTVGAVDRADRLAPFSSRGPRYAGGVVKPDVTAPGVGIVAAAAAGTGAPGSIPGHTAISGTSMATPHVSGAAALLKQKHPGWRAAELRGALASSTADTGHTAYEQGTGRIAVDRALGQTVTPAEVSIGLGEQRWPHGDDTPVTGKLTYRNSGPTDATLDLAVTGHGPGNRPAPAGFFTLGADRVTVPAGGTASVEVTADTRVGGDDGHFAATVTGSGDGRTVRSTVSVEREVESYDVTFRTIGRDGRPSRDFGALVAPVTSLEPGYHFLSSADGAPVVRLTRGEYVLDAWGLVDPTDPATEVDALVQPKLVIDKARTVTLDARRARPVRITGPDPGAPQAAGGMEYTRTGSADGDIGGFYPGESFATLNVAHLGPPVTDGSLSQGWYGHWRGADLTEYNAASGGRVKRLATGYTRAFRPVEFSTVKVALGAPAHGKRATLEPTPHLPGRLWGMRGFGVARPLPDTRTVRLSTGDAVRWSFRFGQITGDDPGGGDRTEAVLESGPRTYRAGGVHRETFNTAVFGPLLDERSGLFRRGDQLVPRIPLFSDGRGHSGSSDIGSARTTLYRNGTRIGEIPDALTGGRSLPIGREAGRFTLTTSVLRGAATARVSSRIDAAWTFRADAAPTDDEVMLPISTVRFSGARVGPDSTAPAGAVQRIALQVHGAAANGGVGSLTAHASYDGGRTWRALMVSGTRATVRNPARGQSVALRAQVTDKQGGTATVTVHDAFFGG